MRGGTLTDKVRAALRLHANGIENAKVGADIVLLPELDPFPIKSVTAALSKLFVHENHGGHVKVTKRPGERARLYWYEDYVAPATAEKTGGYNSYYLAAVDHPQREEQPPYQAECEDIIQTLRMTFDEGCEFKAIWRTAAARLGDRKPGHDALYDAEKRVHYATRSMKWERENDI